jgi:hypothetical protein
MSALPAVRVHVRHALLGGRRPSGRSWTALAVAAASLAVAGPSLASRLPPAAGLLVTPSVVLTLSMAAVVLDQAGPRAIPGPWAVLPVPRRTVDLALRAPWLLVLSALLLLLSPALVAVLVGAGATSVEAVGVVAAAAVAGLGGGLLCSVTASLVVGAVGSRVPAVASAPLATLLWLAWGAASVRTVEQVDGRARDVLALATGWPHLGDVLLGTSGPGHLVAVVLGWGVVAVVLSRAPRPPADHPRVWHVRSFTHLPLVTLAVTRILRARPTRVHLLVAAVLVGCLLLVVRAAPDVGPSSTPLTVVALSCAVCAASARGLDGPVPLEVRWTAGPAGHGLRVLAGTLLCAGPLGVAASVAVRPDAAAAVLVPAALCVTAACVGLAVGAVLGAPAGHPTAELGAAGAFLVVAAVLGALAGDASPLLLAALSLLVATTGLLVGAAAQTRLQTLSRRGLVGSRERRRT